MRFTLISSLIVLAAVPATSNAQVAPTSQPLSVTAKQPAPEVKMQTTSGPTIESAAVGIRPAVSKLDAATAAQQRRRGGVDKSVALMLVGGAAMVAGAIIEDDAGTIFLVGGAVIALYGLYLYLQ